MKNKIIIRIEKIKKKIRVYYFLKKSKKYLKNNNFTIISQNCLGGVLYHELGLKFNSPTINGYFEASDFIKFLSDLKYYLSLKPSLKGYKDGYPVCFIGDLIFYAVHYKSFDEFFNKWEDRKKRVNFNNIFVLMNERDNCSLNLINKFDKLSYKNKVIFTLKDYKNISSSFKIGIPDENNPGWVVGLTGFKSIFSLKRYFDRFNFIDFFNGNTKYNRK